MKPISFSIASIFVPPTPRPMSKQDEVYLLFPTPIGLAVTSGKSQLLHFCSIGQHCPELQAARAIRLKDDVPVVRRPRWKIVAPAVVSKLYPLFAGDIHDVNIRRSRFSGPIL